MEDEGDAEKIGKFVKVLNAEAIIRAEAERERERVGTG